MEQTRAYFHSKLESIDLLSKTHGEINNFQKNDDELEKVTDLSASQHLDPEAYGDFCRPDLYNLLKLLKLDIAYIRGDGDRIFYKQSGQEIAVLDMVGGYGCNLLGHHHPDLQRTLVAALQQKIPVFAQASLKPYSTRLSELLVSKVKKTLSIEDDYLVHLYSTGAEAVEAASLHASLCWYQKRDESLEHLRNSMILATDQKELDRLSSEVDKLSSNDPKFICIKGSFHGKTDGALRLTYNNPFDKLSLPRSAFVEFIDPEADETSLVEVFSKSLIGGLSSFAGLVIELIQCEGGIRPLHPSFVQKIIALAKAANITLIVDEIQTGCYRTGAFLCSEIYGINPDYLILGKALGGGLGKLAALMVRKNLYLDQFGVYRTSTYGEDELTSLIGLKTIQILDKNDLEISENADYFEGKIREGMAVLTEKYPGMIAEVRGHGLLLGIAFNHQLHRKLGALASILEWSGHLGYVFSSYLLHRWQIRLMPSLSNPSVLRLQPSYKISKSSIARIIEGFTDLCHIMAEGRIYELTAHIWQFPDHNQTAALEKTNTPNIEIPIVSPPIVCLKTPRKARRVTFLTHLIDEDHAALFDPSLQRLNAAERTRFLSEYAPMTKSFFFHEVPIRASDKSQEIIFSMRGIACPSKYFEHCHRHNDLDALHRVKEAYRSAIDLDGATYIGLGQYTSIVSANGLLMAKGAVPVTTGNSLTVGIALRTLERLMLKQGLGIGEATVGVVGATGNIGSVIAKLIAKKARHLTLIHREDPKSQGRAQELVQHITKEGYFNPDATHELRIASDISDLLFCDVVIVATNSTGKFITADCVKKNAIILDLSVPSNIRDTTFANRPDVQLFIGGFAKLPEGELLQCPFAQLPEGEVYGCMGETMVLGLNGIQKSFAVGNISPHDVQEILTMADKVGFSAGSLKTLTGF